MILVAQKKHEREWKLVGIFYLLACFVSQLSSFILLRKWMLQTKQKKLKTKEGEAQLVIDNETSRQRLAGTALSNNLPWVLSPPFDFLNGIE